MNRYIHNVLYVAFTGSGPNRADFCSNVLPAILMGPNRNLAHYQVAIGTA